MEKSKKSEIPLIVIGVIVYLLLFSYQGRNAGNTNSLNGILAQMQNLVVILLTVKAHKKGFITSVILSSISFLFVLTVQVIIGGHLTSLPGVIIPIVTILMVYLIYSYAQKMQKANEALSVTIDELNKSNEVLVAKDKKLMYLAYYDVLTGLANKQLIMETIDDKISKNENAPFTIIESNIDNLKEITDTYGLNTADEIIFSYAEKIKNACGDKYFLSRLSTGRFLIIVDGIQSQSDIISITNTINSVINDPIIVKDIAFKTTMSYGVVTYPNNARSTEKIIQCANATVDYVIAHGGNNISFYTENQSSYIRR